jgi:hypothetical protein
MKNSYSYYLLAPCVAFLLTTILSCEKGQLFGIKSDSYIQCDVDGVFWQNDTINDKDWITGWPLPLIQAEIIDRDSFIRYKLRAFGTDNTSSINLYFDQKDTTSDLTVPYRLLYSPTNSTLTYIAEPGDWVSNVKISRVPNSQYRFKYEGTFSGTLSLYGNNPPDTIYITNGRVKSEE